MFYQAGTLAFTLCLIMAHSVLGLPLCLCPLFPSFIMPDVRKHLCESSFGRSLSPALFNFIIAYPPHHLEPPHIPNFIDYRPPFLSHLPARICHPP